MQLGEVLVVGHQVESIPPSILQMSEHNQTGGKEKYLRLKIYISLQIYQHHEIHLFQSRRVTAGAADYSSLVEGKCVEVL
eukprot:15365854-Ditylum_brightwellii.AAC.2